MSIGNGTNNPNIELNYKGFQQNRTEQSLNTTITFQSTKEKLQDAMSTTYKVGTNDTNYGRIDRLNLTQEAGPFWHLTVSYNQPLSGGLIITTGNDNKPTQNSLTVRMMSVPIESHSGYCYIWNHSLATCYANDQIAFGDISGLNAQQAQDFVNQHIDENGVAWVKWIQNDSQLPSQPVKSKDGDQEYLYPWRTIYYMTKPGVSTYDFPTYEIQQNARHKSRDQATWSLLAKNGKLKFPQYGDFGIESYFYGPAASGHWLCEGAGIDYDGKYYVARCTYLFSPDPAGWDLQLYDVASGGYDKNNNNKILGN